ncbi:hypothetical protein [Polaromonas sp. CG_9.11]|uniref:hypothetical protein n=1 Tax=Polaromonas sp. CG_9.11 TaxID=2787730 RepID=UPI0018C9C36F|nr:hypothetical protein [Polaromonas sp. CG_9.11]MBG6078201.1 hypothetical protein [Polaromonas sp. CG_9.11]
MTKSMPYNRAVPFSRPAGRRRIEVFSPKIGRRLCFGGYDAYRTWLVIEANPDIAAFCERPTYVDGLKSPVIDFWVQLRGASAGEFWMVEGQPRSSSKVGTAPPERHSHLHELPVRYINRADLIGWAVPIGNWARIIPYLVSHRRYRDTLLEQQIMVFLNEDESVDSVLAHFPQRDGTTVQAALFQLLAEGRITSPDLAIEPMDGSTRFHRLPVVLASAPP